MWYHIKCGGISAATYSSILNIESEGKEYQWECPRCSLPKLNDSFFNNTTEEEILEDSLESPPASPPRSSIHKSSKLKIMTMNCRGIKSLRKRAELYATLDRENPDILLGTESHLDSSVYNAEVFPEDTGYNIIRKDRNKHGGGVFIAYKDYLTVTHIPEIGKTTESVFAKVKVQKDQFMYVGCVYRPPDTKEHTLLATHEDLRQLLGKERLPHVVLGGDFNAPSCNWEYLNYPPSPSYGNKINELLLDIVREQGLAQLTNSPTREENILDLIFSSHPGWVEETQVVPGISDHKAVSATIRVRPSRTWSKPRQVYIFKKAKKEQMEKDLETLRNKYEENQNSRSVEANWIFIKDGIMKCINDNVPTKKIHPGKDLPWINHNVKKQIRKKKALYKKAKGNHALWPMYLKKEKEVKQLIEKSYLDYINGLMEENEGDKGVSKRLWSFIRSRKKDTSGISVLQNADGIHTSDSRAKAKLLSDQYKSVFTEEDTTNMPQMSTTQHPSARPLKITKNGIIKQLEKLNPRKAIGPDLIPTTIIKEHREIIAPMLTHLFQQSIDNGSVPMDWKKANICAIFKKGDRTICKNYRPVSLTCVMCKILEHVVASHIMSHLDDNDILVHYQHGFRRKLHILFQVLKKVVCRFCAPSSS